MIDILMATYNGEKYLAEQIESIINQTYTDWHLYIQDDVSSDSTAEIAREYSGKYPDKITVIVRDTPSGGAKENFLSMLPLAKSDYVMFSDQDDVWLPEKIEVTHSKMLESEQKYGREMPLLVHTDLTVVDEKLEVISPSLFEFEKYKNNNSFSGSLLSCKSAGCTAEINIALYNIIKTDCLDDIYIHDWWVELIALAFGKEISLNQPTILYRQHSSNEIGVDGNMGIASALKRVFVPERHKSTKAEVNKQNKTFKAFYNNYKNELSESDRRLLAELVASQDKNKISKVLTVLKNHLGAPSIRGYIYYLVFC